MKNILDMKIQIIQEMINKEPDIEITYFIPDNKKNGGKYNTITGVIKKIDFYYNKLIMQSGLIINVDEILDISGEIF